MPFDWSVYSEKEISAALRLVEGELRKALDKHAAFNSAHEGYAVVLEELDELWGEVKKQQYDYEALSVEAAQVGAMALRFIIDVVGV